MNKSPKKEYHKSLEKICTACGKLFRVCYSNYSRFVNCSMECRKTANTKKREAKEAKK